jgi:aerotaxis receptor
VQISGYKESELIGKPHNLVRHPDMPKAVYRLMWDTIKKQEEFFGVVKNLCKNGGYYWTFANVTPSFDENNSFIGYFSVRRHPGESLIKIVEPLYKKMCAVEANNASNKERAIDASMEILNEEFSQLGGSYNEVIYTNI